MKKVSTEKCNPIEAKAFPIEVVLGLLIDYTLSLEERFMANWKFLNFLVGFDTTELEFVQLAPVCRRELRNQFPQFAPAKISGIVHDLTQKFEKATSERACEKIISAWVNKQRKRFGTRELLVKPLPRQTYHLRFASC